MKISIVMPVYNSANTIAALVEELIKNYQQYETEIVLVNDGSRDNSDEVCNGLCKKYTNVVRYICLTKNFGEHNAVMAGLNYVTGDYAVIIDDDFQNPPEEIHKLIDAASSGKYDVVYSYYNKKYHSWFRNVASELNNFVATFLLNKPRDLYLSSFKCLNKLLIKEVIKYTGPFPYIDGLILRATSNIGRVAVRHQQRKEGCSGYTLKKLIKLWLNMFINFSIAPLRFSVLLGFTFSVIGVILSIYIVIDKIIHPNVPVGITSIIVGILVFAGIQLIMLGVIGEYIGKQFLSGNQTPQYVVRSING